MTIFELKIPTVEQLASVMMWVLCVAGIMVGLLIVVSVAGLVIDILRRILKGDWIWD